MRPTDFNIEFLRYVELSPEDVKEMTDEPVRVFISPDVKSLHLTWVYEDWAWFHEIVDYPNMKPIDYIDRKKRISTIKELLEDELCDDSWDCGDESDEDGFLELLSDWGNYSTKNPPAILKLVDIVN